MKKSVKLIVGILAVAASCALSVMLSVCLLGYGMGWALMKACTAATYRISYELNEDGESYAVSSVGRNLDEVAVPAEYNGKPVTRIADYAFTVQPFMTQRTGLSLDKLTLPATVRVVEDRAFYSSGRIEELYYEGTLADWYAISFGSSPLGGSTDLYIGGELLTEFSVPDGVTEIGSYLFCGYSYFGKIVIPDGVISVGAYAFYGCENLLQAVAPQSLACVGENAFGGCDRLVEVYNFSPAEDWWGEQALAVHRSEEESCLQQRGDFTMFYGEDRTVTLFYRGEGGSVALPDLSGRNYEVYRGLFAGNQTLTAAILPEGLTEIGKDAFRDCRALTTVTLPRSLTRMEAFAFGFCGKLSEVVYGGTREEWDAVVKDRNWDYNAKDFAVRCTDGVYGDEVEDLAPPL